jgi:DNA-directed RNA polymerase subunit RPC12/RpoP
MGIRFKCSHCQKRLNVKAAQAGQSGQCPKCSQTITVPQHSEVEWIDSDGRTEVMDSQSIFDVDNQITQAGLNATIQLESDSKLSEFTNPFTGSSGPRIARRSSNFHSTESFLLDKPQPPSTLGKVDPIAEAPRKIWYFRSKKLGERGPLKAKTMRQHVENGDVTIGCIVWREDWEDWQPAERVFPKLVQEMKERAAARLAHTAQGIPEELNPHSPLRRRQRRLQMLGIIAIAAGLLTIGGLTALLVKLVSN